MTLTDFLLARIAEDQASALEVREHGAWWVEAYDDYDGRSPELVEYFVVAPPPAPGVPRDDQGDPDDPRHVTSVQGDPALAAALARWSPARVLAECEAKRRIVESARRLGSRDGVTPEELLGNLALPYADHPDYDETWRT
ncbi:hypothetical protein JN535_04180 [Cellulosimicrobium cellulans]|uniref:DUF6221 family protein n=1 Tax=Cellulosimicrobium cellulans TaxID=1710 RepID=UPI0019656370|nr:DUF6221 family protein [Cellulosimicrobium cellulans]MBN0039372.1 hypothetical protein [Cellulosimicrobium cellulans]